MEEIEIKHELNLNECPQCPTCLSVGRRLIPLGKYNNIYRKIKSDMDFNSMLSLENLAVCWECRAMLKKIELFQQRAEKAHEILQLGQAYFFSTLSNLTSNIICDNQIESIFSHAKSKDYVETDIKKSEITTQIEDQNYCNDSYINEFIEQNAEPDNEEIEIEVKPDIEQTVLMTKTSKTLTRWAKNKALQNKKPKFKMLTEINTNDIFKTLKIDCKELEKCLTNRKISKSYLSKRYKCKSCIVGYKTEMSLLRHNNKHHREELGIYTCDICASIFKNKCHLASHINKHYHRYQCLVCDFNTNSIKRRNEHIEKHKKIFQCLKCKLMFGHRREFYKHFKEWHEKFTCHHCGVSFKMRYCIEDHIRKQHSTFECKPCNKLFARYNGLWLHNKIHHSTATVCAYCVECDKQYPDVYRYRWHLANSARHTPRKRVRIPCPGCDKVFSKNIYMKDHYNLVHLKNYKYRCEDCDKNFIRNADLVKHRRRVHEGILPPRNKICYMCGRGFTTNKILSNHVRTHTGERPFACTLCPARFAQSSALHSHTRALHHGGGA